MRSRSEILAELEVIEDRTAHLKDQHQRIVSSLTGHTGTLVAGTLTAAGIAAAWSTFGVSLGLSLLGGIWFAKETRDKIKIRNRVERINGELAALAIRRRSLQAELLTAPPP
jgi:hypothetical protein